MTDKEQEKFFGLLNAAIANCTTEALIAELEKRRPCKRCVSWQKDSTPCFSCFWKYLWVVFNSDIGKQDNFKEAK